MIRNNNTTTESVEVYVVLWHQISLEPFSWIVLHAIQIPINGNVGDIINVSRFYLPWLGNVESTLIVNAQGSFSLL